MKTFLALVMALLVYPFPTNIEQTGFKPITLEKFVLREIKCLADNVYYEALSEPHLGKMAVAFVTMNRVRSGVFPETVCGVVKQKIGNVCQFSWYCTPQALPKINEAAYNSIKSLVMHVYFHYDELDDPSDGALFFHADYVKTNWKKVVKTKAIGRHIFYTYMDLV